ncbi:MAG TPA: helix-hairpin-helix domain-containing protein [Terracidiphilus sp.]|jgi:DNA uptake protein ComE-like DNA-binding protein
MRNAARIALVTLFLALPLSVTGLVLPVAESQSKPAAPAPEDRLDINTATIDQLMKVPGLTRTWAARIIRYRPYRGKNDLIDRGVVTSQVYDRAKDYIIAHRQAR